MVCVLKKATSDHLPRNGEQKTADKLADKKRMLISSVTPVKYLTSDVQCETAGSEAAEQVRRDMNDD